MVTSWVVWLLCFVAVAAWRRGSGSLVFFVSSYPHVLLAVAAFGVAFLLAPRPTVDADAAPAS